MHFQILPTVMKMIDEAPRYHRVEVRLTNGVQNESERVQLRVLQCCGSSGYVHLLKDIPVVLSTYTQSRYLF